MKSKHTNLPQKYILIDFNCANEYTHHWSSVLSYAHIIKSQSFNLEIWLPVYASNNISKKISEFGKIQKILRSPQYGVENISAAPISYILAKMTNLIFKSIHISQLLKNFTRLIIIRIYLFGLIKRINKESKNFQIRIVFPSLDFLGLKLLQHIVAKNPDVEVYARRMGAETKGPLTVGNELSLLLQILESESGSRIRVGIPTLNLCNSLKKTLINSERIFWSPLPSVLKSNTYRFLEEFDKIRIGFPGTAKESKGYDLIPEIISNYVQDGIDLDVLIQKTKHPWDRYNESREKIMLSGATVQEFDAVLGIEEYGNFLNRCDVIYLPYQSKHYKEADSGILYEAADRNIPIFCNKGLGFSEEAYIFGIGVDPANLKSSKDLFQVANSMEIKSNIRSYNNLRNKTIMEFLNL
jgi:hypothetical protein